MTVLETNIIAVVLPSIANDLRADFASVEWVVSSYITCFVCSLLPAGSIADRLGRKKVLLFGIAAFSLTTLLCAVAPNSAFLYVMRGAQGISASFLLAPSLAIIGHTFHRGVERDEAWAFWGGFMGLMMVLSPVAGGAVAHAVGWRWAFGASLPILAVLALGTMLFVQESKNAEHRPLDPMGIATFSASMFGIVFLVIQGAALGWMSREALAGAVLAAAAGAMFIRSQSRTASGMLDLQLFRSRRFVGAVLAMIGYAGCAQVMASMIPQYLQNGLGYSALEAGLGMLPFAGAMLAMPFLSQRLSSLTGWRCLATGLSIISLGGFIACFASWNGWSSLMLVGTAVVGAGGGMINGETSKAIIGAVSKERAGMASGISATSRFLGILAGYTGLSSLIISSIHWHASELKPAHLTRDALDAIAAGTFHDSALLASARALYGKGFGTAMMVSACTALFLAGAVALLMSGRPEARVESQAPSR